VAVVGGCGFHGVGHCRCRVLLDQDQRRAAEAGAGHPGTQAASGTGGVNRAVQFWTGYLKIIS
jgi:hypothetical protein